MLLLMLTFRCFRTHAGSPPLPRAKFLWFPQQWPMGFTISPPRLLFLMGLFPRFFAGVFVSLCFKFGRSRCLSSRLYLGVRKCFQLQMDSNLRWYRRELLQAPINQFSLPWHAYLLICIFGTFQVRKRAQTPCFSIFYRLTAGQRAHWLQSL